MYEISFQIIRLSVHFDCCVLNFVSWFLIYECFPKVSPDLEYIKAFNLTLAWLYGKFRKSLTKKFWDIYLWKRSFLRRISLWQSFFQTKGNIILLSKIWECCFVISIFGLFCSSRFQFQLSLIFNMHRHLELELCIY